MPPSPAIEFDPPGLLALLALLALPLRRLPLLRERERGQLWLMVLLLLSLLLLAPECLRLQTRLCLREPRGWMREALASGSPAPTALRIYSRQSPGRTFAMGL